MFTGVVTMLPAAVTHITISGGFSEFLDDVVCDLFRNFVADIFNPRFGQFRPCCANLVHHIINSSDDTRIRDGVV